MRGVSVRVLRAGVVTLALLGGVAASLLTLASGAPAATTASKTVTVTVTATTPQTTTASGAPRVLSPPTIFGIPFLGKTITATNGSFAGSAPLTYAYQWYVCLDNRCGPLPGATNPTLRIVNADIGYQFAIDVTVFNGLGQTSAVSLQTQKAEIATHTLDRWLHPVLVPAGTNGQLAAILRAGTYRTSFTAAIAGTLAVNWSLITQDGDRSVATTVATATQNTAIGSTPVTIKLTSAGHRLLGKLTRAHLRTRASFRYRPGRVFYSYGTSRLVTLG